MSVEEKIKQAIELLIEAAEKRGAYSRDQHEFAMNVIENTSERASKSVDILQNVLKILKVERENLRKLLNDFPCEPCMDIDTSLSPCQLDLVTWYKTFKKFVELFGDLEKKENKRK